MPAASRRCKSGQATGKGSQMSLTVPKLLRMCVIIYVYACSCVLGLLLHLVCLCMRTAPDHVCMHTCVCVLGLLLHASMCRFGRGPYTDELVRIPGLPFTLCCVHAPAPAPAPAVCLDVSSSAVRAAGHARVHGRGSFVEGVVAAGRGLHRRTGRQRREIELGRRGGGGSRTNNWDTLRNTYTHHHTFNKSLRVYCLLSTV